MVGQRVHLARYNDWRLPFNSDSGFYSDLVLLDDLQPPRTVHDYENYIARLNDYARAISANKSPICAGHPRWLYAAAPRSSRASSRVIGGFHCASPEAIGLYAPFAQFSGDRAGIRSRAFARSGARRHRDARNSGVRRVSHLLRNEYAPAYARNTIAAPRLPNGRAYYADLVRYFTTLPDATPQANPSHRVSAEVARIHAEMEVEMHERPASTARSRNS